MDDDDSTRFDSQKPRDLGVTRDTPKRTLQSPQRPGPVDEPDRVQIALSDSAYWAYNPPSKRSDPRENGNPFRPTVDPDPIKTVEQ